MVRHLYVYSTSNMVYFCHKWVCMFSIWRGPGNICTPFVSQMFQHFGKFGDWSWGLCYLFCLGPTDYACLSQQCLVWDVAALDKLYQWVGYVVRQLKTHLWLTIEKIGSLLAYASNSRLMFCMKNQLIWGDYWRRSISVETLIWVEQAQQTIVPRSINLCTREILVA